MNNTSSDDIDYKNHIDTSIPEKGYKPIPIDKTDIVISILKEIKDAISFSGQSERTKYYNKSGTSTVAVTSVPSISSSLYTKEPIYNTIGRKAEKLYIINRGPGNLYVRASYIEGELFTDEIHIKEDEYIILKNVYELRHRSDTINLSYTVAEYEIGSSNTIIKGTDGNDLQIISVDSNGNMIALIKGEYNGTLKTVAVDSVGLMQTDVSKAEKIEIVSTISTTNFTEAIAMYAQETENITGLSSNRYMVRAVNIQSIQPLKYRLIFWGKDTFDDTDLEVDSYIDDVELDMTSSPTFRINNTNQYLLNVGGMEILYEDYDSTNELHISLQNLSATSKIAGVLGAVQIDIKMSPRL